MERVGGEDWRVDGWNLREEEEDEEDAQDNQA